MSEIRKELLYTKDHEWLEKSEKPGCAKIGITDFAQESLGDVTFVELPEVGKSFARGEVFGTVESVKAVSELFAPVAMKVLSVNPALSDDPAVLNTHPYNEGWVAEIEITTEADLTELLSAAAYESHAQ